jgi:hypothetical protein
MTAAEGGLGAQRNDGSGEDASERGIISGLNGILVWQEKGLPAGLIQVRE